MMDKHSISMDAQRITSAAQSGIRRAQQTRMRRRIALVLAAALVVSTGALASGTIRQWIGWNGLPIAGISSQPEPTPMPNTVGAAPMEAITSWWASYQNQAKPATQLWIGEHSEIGQSLDGLTEPFDSLAALADTLRETPFKLPTLLPDNYAPGTVTLHYALTPANCESAELVEEIPGPGGAVMRKYRFDERIRDNPWSYALNTYDERGQLLSIDACLDFRSTIRLFDNKPDERATPLDVPGMEHALLIESDGIAELHMQQNIAETSYISIFGFKRDGHAEPEIHDAIVYYIRGDGLSGEQLQQIALGMK